ncbi:MAG: 2-oxo acid dehydrogenase subunit E2 [Thermomicrobiales bacterium]
MDAILEKPVVRNGGIAIRSMVTIGITFDHRIFATAL